MVFGPGKRFVLGINSADRDLNRNETILKSNMILGKFYEPGYELGYAPFRFSDLSSLEFSLTARITKLVDPAGGGDPNPNKNFSYNRVYFYIEKIEPEWIESPAQRKFFYFIIPIYDKEYTIHPGIIKTDPLSGRLAYVQAQSTFTGTKSFNDMQWITIKKDLLPLIANAIQEAYARGYVDSNDLADYTISRVQLSQLEVSHPIDIEIEYKDYYLKAVYKDTGSDITPPIVSLTAPAGGATVSGNVTISANASDNVGVTGVQFKVDGTNVGAEDTTVPYSIPWDSTTVTNGSHNIRAVARDAAGNTRWSAMRSVTVGNNTAVITSKKGGALANSRMQGHSYTATNILNALNISWYYNWREGDKIHANGVFVPMVWRQDTIDEAEVIYQSSSKKFPVLLAFNEPNNPGMASRDPPQVLLTPAEAASYWDRLTAISTRISAPAPSDGPNGGADGSWLDAFMKLTADKGKRVDFVTLHWYGAPDATKFLNDVDALWNKYQRPIWVTEFAVKDPPANPNKYTEDDVINFMKVALRGLEDRPYVERYAWFGTDGSAGVFLDQSTLFDEITGELTKVGKFYAAWDPSGTPTPSLVLAYSSSPAATLSANPIGTLVNIANEGSDEWSQYNIANKLASVVNVNATIRFPGGTTSNNYNWQTGKLVDPNLYPKAVSEWTDENVPSSRFTFDEYMTMVNGRGFKPFVTVNVLSAFREGGTQADIDRYVQLAADWVRYAKNKGYKVKYWEVGNEPYVHPDVFGVTTRQEAAPIYVKAYKQYYNAIKSVDPTAQVGIVGSLAGSNWWPYVMAENPKFDFVTVHRYESNAS